LIDRGFKEGALPLWQVPVVVIGLFLLRGVFGFNLAVFAGMGGQPWRAVAAHRHVRPPDEGRAALFGSRSASSLTNTLVHEVQAGAQQMMNGMNTMVKDFADIDRPVRLPDVFELAIDAPGLGAAARRRLGHAHHGWPPAQAEQGKCRGHRTSWPTWSRKNVLAWRIVRDCTARPRSRPRVSEGQRAAAQPAAGSRSHPAPASRR